MKKGRTKRPRDRSQPVQYFTFGPLEFNIDRATRLAGNRDKYQPQRRRPWHDWIGPNIEVHEQDIDSSDLNQPVLFATLIMEGHPWQLLIDGNHRVCKALRQQTEVLVLTLDLEDTLRVLSGPVGMLQQMRRDGERLGLLRSQS